MGITNPTAEVFAKIKCKEGYKGPRRASSARQAPSYRAVPGKGVLATRRAISAAGAHQQHGSGLPEGTTKLTQKLVVQSDSRCVQAGAEYSHSFSKVS